MRLTFPIAAFSLAIALPLSAQADVVSEWNQHTLDELEKLGVGANPASRALAITQIAVYEAVNASSGSYQPYHALLSPTLPVSQEAAAASAAYQALVLQFPSEKAALDALLTQSLTGIADGPAKQHGIELGQAAAVDIYTLRIGDGSSTTSSYPGSTDVGKWRPTPLADVAAQPLPALEPSWRFVTPFALQTPDQFRPAAPPAVTSDVFASAYVETKGSGKIDSATRTADQTQSATFWNQTIEFAFNEVARSVVETQTLSVDESARLFALLNITLADARIAAWDAQYAYGYWRPISAIDTTTTYGTAAVVDDPSWLPLLETPNDPEYPSAVSAVGGGALSLFTQLFGDSVSLTVDSGAPSHATRTFSSWASAEQELGDSLIFGGVQFRFSTDAGIHLGHQVAGYVVSNYLKALPAALGEGGAAGESSAGSAGEASLSTGAGGSRAALGEAGSAEAGSAEAGEGPNSGGTGGTGGSGGKGGSSGSGGAGKPTLPAVAAEDDDDTSCAVAQPGRGSGALSVALLMAAIGVGLRLRRRRS